MRIQLKNKNPHHSKLWGIFKVPTGKRTLQQSCRILNPVATNKKAQESLVSNKLITMILIILVIVGMLFILFRPQFLDWIKNLPGYGAPSDSEIDMSKVPADQLAKYGCPAEKIVAAIGSKDVSIVYGVDLREISIYRNEIPNKLNIFADVYKPTDYVFKIRKPIFQSDIILGHVENDILTINPDFITNYNAPGSRYSDIRNYISLDDLKKLDKSTLYNTFVLCKI